MMISHKCCMGTLHNENDIMLIFKMEIQGAKSTWWLLKLDVYRTPFSCHHKVMSLLCLNMLLFICFIVEQPWRGRIMYLLGQPILICTET